ncbi:unnamed protein product [Scytosiphon promiscuus]
MWWMRLLFRRSGGAGVGEKMGIVGFASLSTNLFVSHSIGVLNGFIWLATPISSWRSGGKMRGGRCAGKGMRTWGVNGSWLSLTSSVVSLRLYFTTRKKG